MTRNLVEKALINTHYLRKRPKGVVFHSDRGSQYTSGVLQSLWNAWVAERIWVMFGACWDHVVVERFFGRLKSTMGYLRCHNRLVSMCGRM
jgi:putative transposase